MSGTLVIAGLGPRPAETATIEALHALGRCDAIYVIHRAAAGGGSVDRFLRGFCPGVRVRDYSVLKIKAELARGNRVGVVSAGHPLLFSAEAALVYGLGAPIETFGAVSILDETLASRGLSLGKAARGVRVLPGSVAFVEGGR